MFEQLVTGVDNGVWIVLAVLLPMAIALYVSGEWRKM